MSKNAYVANAHRLDMAHETAGVAVNVVGETGSTVRERQCWRVFKVYFFSGIAALLFVLCVLWRATRASSVDAKTGLTVEYSVHYFILCFIGGALAGVTHFFIIPIDLVKCRMQVGECNSIREGLRQIIHGEARGHFMRALPCLLRGWVPTIVGYAQQGGLKYALYEIIKYHLLIRRLQGIQSGAKAPTTPVPPSLFIFLFASFCAELLADIALSPWEAMKIRIQTTRPHAPHVRFVLPHIWLSEGWYGFYKGIVPLWGRQIPSTMMKFASFEKIVELLHYFLARSATADAAAMVTIRGRKVAAVQASSGVEFCISLLAGLLAGVLCGLVSHPADTILSKLNQIGRKEDGVALSGAVAMTTIVNTGANNNNNNNGGVVLIAAPTAGGGPNATMTSVNGAATCINNGIGNVNNGVTQGTLGQTPATLTHKSPPAQVIGGHPHNGNTSADDLATLHNASPSAPRTSRGDVGGRTLRGICRELGWRGVWKGLLPRLAMISIATALQWIAYDTFKMMVNLPSTGRSRGGNGT